MASYVDSNLTPNEHVVHRTHLHWITFFSPTAIAVFAVWLLAAGIAAAAAEDGAGVFSLGVFSLGVMIFLFAGILFLGRFITWKTSEFAVTNQRVMIKVGWIRRNTLELLLKKVETVSVDQGIFGRMLGFGNITVSGTGGARNPFKYIQDPLAFRTKVTTLVSEVS